MRKKIEKRCKEIQNERGRGGNGKIRKWVAYGDVEVKRRRKRRQ